jgi:hypothetical protein
MAPPSSELLVEVEEQLDCALPAADDITISTWLGLEKAPAAAPPLGPEILAVPVPW